MKPSITAVYLVYNQSQLLQQSLASLGETLDQILIVDLGSTEELVKIAKKYHAVYQRLPYTPVVETVREQVFHKVKTDYIFYLDADESVTPDLITQLRQLAQTGVDYALLPRQNIIFNTWVKASRWWPDYQIRFFKPAALKWPKKLHAQPIPSGTQTIIPAEPELAIIHHNYQNLDEWFDKNRRYAKVDAQDRLNSQESFTLQEAMKLSISELVSRFFAGRGYTDGMHGLMLSILQSFYYFFVYAYYWEAKKYSSDASDNPRSFPRQWFTHGLSEILYWEGRAENLLTKIKLKIKRRIIL